ncbi:hypothetical protein [Xylophilus sp. Leaf220]|nr:hypothetical protein [Xylophilus sp. Leaf220]
MADINNQNPADDLQPNTQVLELRPQAVKQSGGMRLAGDAF